MPILKEIQGDLFKPFQKKNYDIMVHGCNCFHSFGAGFAAVVKRKYYLAYKADLQTSKGSPEKLGSYSSYKSSDGLIINLYSQFHYGFGKVNADIEAIKKGFELINKEYPNTKLCIPRIGAGLAKGNWDVISKTINEVTPDLDITVYVL